MNTLAPTILPFAFAKRHGVILKQLIAEQAYLYCRPDFSLQTLNEVRRFLARPVQLETISSEQFDILLTRHYEQQANQSMQMMEGIGDELDLFQVAQQLSSEPEDLLESSDDAPIIRLINALLSEAIKENASDIHIEPFESRLVVRFRVDGVLREVLQPRRVLAPLLVSRIKVMAKLDIAEKRLPQDGRISLRIAGRAVDVRVSTIPSGHGERVVLRLLDKQAGRLNLQDIGMPDDMLSRLQAQLIKPHGIILVTGPTGSGKTTSLYAMLNYLNDHSRNIMTVEDPIEYYLDGIGQTQVNTKVNMTFARGLRAILRQDPDVVMVGEIRDAETAQIAVQASLTGHLVLSTLHTNTAIGAVTRLRDMGIEPFLLSSSLLSVMSQRLVRLLCPACKTPYLASLTEKEALQRANLPPDLTLYAANGCKSCNHIGYKGRTGIYELIDVDGSLRTMIHDQIGQHELEAYAHQRQSSMLQNGTQQVLAGDSTIEELLRVTREG
ncbi:type II secretion system ATPase GspE [Beggiatoa leptomitoformis]|uniref:Type II secretion system protein E n=1 Tax=Beggiatoa leptomitoformis TaxID=288004 RepID=A0A2N9YDK9_9GAMM|nr:type II secretion system ATPase GspE [Beggiatoa leptomitoformis]ALG69550.2 type II secretion system ATPase GspE [Beggiatoa leptomitoformis]AUI68573.1 type II secretion system ATPase GspE [Beggiatoa leptomitoformis]